MLFVVLLFATAIQAQHPCLPCHRSEVEHFSKSAMGNSVSPSSGEPEGQFDHSASGARVHIFWKNGELRHQVEQSGLTANLPAAYAIGFGNVGRSYLVEIGGHLFQSPAAFYTAKHAWAESPGYETDPVLDFWRPIDSSCLSCHTGSVQQKENRVALTPITCDRCHGDPTQHLKNPVPGSIVNPARLSGTERDSVCEQCHLEGATIVLNPGKHWADFKPGQALEQIQVTYLLQSENKGAAAVSHAEQLALSACKRNSPAKLWCATCHDPHSSAGDHKQEISQVCGSCHAPDQLAATHKAADTNCVGCHMPKIRATDISHAAITDHRILKRPADEPIRTPANTSQRVVAWKNPAASLTNRDLGLALFNLARSGRPEGSYPDAFRLLSASASPVTDATVQAAQGYMLLGSGHTQSAIECFRRAVADNDASAEYWLDLGVAQQAAADNRAAEQAYRESIQRNPTDYRPYQALAALLKKEGKPDLATQAVQQFLQINPQSILMRLQPGT